MKRILFSLFSASVLSLALAQEPGTVQKAVESKAGDPVNPLKWNEDPLDTPRFPHKAYFRKRFEVVSNSIELRPPAHIEDFVQSGKLELSLKNYLDLVMGNNTDIEIQRLVVETQKNAITRAFAPFDPNFFGSFTNQRSKTQSISSLDGASTLNNLSQPGQFTFNHTLDSGLQYSAGLTTSKLSTNSSNSTVNPAYSTQFTTSFIQPLLRNRGRDVNRLPITIARGNLKSGFLNSEAAIQRLLVTAENAYWDVIAARETLLVQEKALELASEALKRSRRELELGAISPLDIYQPEAQYAAAEIQVSQSRFRLQQTEDALRRQISVDLNAELRNLPIVLTESVLPPTDEAEMDREKLVVTAMRARPELKRIRNEISVDDLEIRQAQNLLRPDFSLRGGYITTGRGGNQFARGLLVSQGGFGDSLGQLFGFGFPIWNFGLQLRLPLRDRAAQAAVADTLIGKKIDALNERTLAQTVRQEVLQAVSQVESSKASVKLAIVNRDLARKQLDAEQKKYDLGVQQIFFVLDAQGKLVNAESQLVNQSVQYRRNLLNLLRSTGELLDSRGIRVQ